MDPLCPAIFSFGAYLSTWWLRFGPVRHAGQAAAPAFGVNVLVLYLQERFGWRSGHVQMASTAPLCWQLLPASNGCGFSGLCCARVALNCTWATSPLALQGCVNVAVTNGASLAGPGKVSARAVRLLVWFFFLVLDARAPVAGSCCYCLAACWAELVPAGRSLLRLPAQHQAR